MEYDEARQTILYHAGLIAPGEGERQSYADTLFWSAGTGVLPNIRPDAQLLVEALHAVNQHLLEAAATPVSHCPRNPDEQIVYAIASILERGLEFLSVESRGPQRDHRAIDAFQQSLWRVATAWEAVLGGNISSITDFVEQEARARGIVSIRQIMAERRRMARVP